MCYISCQLINISWSKCSSRRQSAIEYVVIAFYDLFSLPVLYFHPLTSCNFDIFIWEPIEFESTELFPLQKHTIGGPYGLTLLFFLVANNWKNNGRKNPFSNVAQLSEPLHKSTKLKWAGILIQYKISLGCLSLLIARLLIWLGLHNPLMFYLYF